jgi:hypothetical protein
MLYKEKVIWELSKIVVRLSLSRYTSPHAACVGALGAGSPDCTLALHFSASEWQALLTSNLAPSYVEIFWLSDRIPLPKLLCRLSLAPDLNLTPLASFPPLGDEENRKFDSTQTFWMNQDGEIRLYDGIFEEQ